MSDLKIHVDVEGIAKEFKDFSMEVEQDLTKAIGELAAITHAKVLEEAQQQLKTSRKEYTDALGFEEISPGVWVVSLADEALWIEDGLPQNFDMKPGLLKDGKISKTGVRYRVIPFDHSAPPSSMTPAAQSIVTGIKQNLKKNNVPFKKIEFNADGSPRTGKLHSFDFGGEIPGKGNTPSMKGVNIYQTLTKTGSVRRDIMTFRTVTNGPGSDGKWIHPGVKAHKFLDSAYAWALQKWETEILPEVLKKWE